MSVCPFVGPRRNRFLAITPPHVVRFTLGTDHNVLVPGWVAVPRTADLVRFQKNPMFIGRLGSKLRTPPRWSDRVRNMT